MLRNNFVFQQITMKPTILALHVTCLIGLATAPSPFTKFGSGPQVTQFNNFSPLGPFGQQPFFPAASTLISHKAPPAIKATDRKDVLEVVFQWNILDYKFDSPAQRQMYLDSG